MQTPTTTLGYLRPLLRVMQEKGINLDTLHIPRQSLNESSTDGRLRIPAEVSRALIEQAAQLCPDKPLWKSMIRHTRYHDMGGLGLSLEAGGNLLDVLQRIAYFHSLVSDALTLRISVHNDYCRLLLVATDTNTPHRQSLLYVIGLLVQYCRSRSDNRLLPQCIGLPASTSEESAMLGEYCACKVEESAVAFVEFRGQDLQAPLSDSDTELAHSLDTVLQGRLDVQKHTYANVLKQWLRVNMGETMPRLSLAANALHMSERSLQRRLHDEGISWTTLLKSTRQQMMETILPSPDVPITEVALTLGYTHATSFSRAFRKQYGVAPSDYRKHRMYTANPLEQP
jgi:AraC-like DNA-binding protein